MSKKNAMKNAALTYLLLDIGGVLLTNGWDHHAPQKVLYIENTPMFVEIAEGLGIQSILHTDYKSTCTKLASFGLHNYEGAIHETN